MIIKADRGVLCHGVKIPTCGTRNRGARTRQSSVPGPVERFCLIIESFALAHTYEGELAFIGASEMRNLEPVHYRRIARLRDRMQQMVDTEVADAVATGRFRPDNSKEAARAVVTMCTTIPTWWRPGGELTPEDVARQYVGFAMDVMTGGSMRTTAATAPATAAGRPRR